MQKRATELPPPPPPPPPPPTHTHTHTHTPCNKISKWQMTSHMGSKRIRIRDVIKMVKMVEYWVIIYPLVLSHLLKWTKGSHSYQLWAPGTPVVVIIRMTNRAAASDRKASMTTSSFSEIELCVDVHMERHPVASLVDLLSNKSSCSSITPFWYILMTPHFPLF